MEYLTESINKEIKRLKDSIKADNEKINLAQSNIQSAKKYLEQCLACLQIFEPTQTHLIKDVIPESAEQEKILKIVQLLRLKGSVDVHVKHLTTTGLRGFKSPGVISRWMDQIIHKLGSRSPWKKSNPMQQVYSLNLLEEES